MNTYQQHRTQYEGTASEGPTATALSLVPPYLLVSTATYLVSPTTPPRQYFRTSLSVLSASVPAVYASPARYTCLQIHKHGFDES
eukprot:3932299-Rhodomonas_salina.1